MSTRSLQFNGMRISSLLRESNFIEITFHYATIIKNMDAAIEDSKWYGAGVIRLEDFTNDDFELPTMPAVLSGADICDNQMIYRNEVAIPLKLHGHVGIKLKFNDDDQIVSIFGENLTLDLIGHEKYIEHIKA